MSEFSFNFAGNGRGMTAPPKVGPDDYPLDLDGSLDYTRGATGWTLYPDPATYPNGAGIGCVSGFLRQFDMVLYQQMVARIPWGPEINGVPTDPTRYSGQAIFPNLMQTGSADQGLT